MLNFHNYTAQGSLESIITIDQLMAVDSPVMSIIDPTLISAIEFYEACMEYNKKPIIGLDTYVSFGQVDMLLQRYNQIASRLTLVAYNKAGYENLVRLSTFGYLHGFYKVPRIDIYQLQKYNEGLLCLINNIDSSIALHLQNNNKIEAMKDLAIYRKIFKNRLYAEHMVGFYDLNFKEIIDTPYIVTNQAKYINRDDYELWQIYMAINQNILLNEYKKQHNANLYYYNQRIDDVGDLWNLVDRVEDYGLDKMEAKFPKMKMTKNEFNLKLIYQLKKKKLLSNRYIKRLEYELNVINKFGYKDYFLMVADLIYYCNNNLSGYISAGRGSVGGCLIAYLLGITRIDPINPTGFTMQIPFDRFLNSNRKVLPDIDLDFNPRDRQAIIDYLKERYGEDSCRNMLTIVTMGARGALREIARITNNLSSEMDAIIKSFPPDQHLTLDMVKESDIYEHNRHNSKFVKLFKLAQQLEGLPKSYGVHASGIAVSSRSMDGFIPISKYNNREVTQYKQEQLEYVGVIKFDILGLNTLQIISDALNMINPTFSIQEQIEWLESISLDDHEVYDYINTGRTAGIFQWDTHNYRTVINDVKPSNFKELVDLNTLGRSAALLSGLTDRYIRRKNGQEEIKALHPQLEGLMKETMELPLYQEQIMLIFTSLASYSQAEADDVRKAIGKKLPELMKKQRNIFIQRCKKNGIGESDATIIWAMIDKFSKYTWNLGHAMAYTRICYETAYLAYRYPKEFFCANINNSKSSMEAGRFIDAMKKRKIMLHKVNINKSQREYTVQDGKVISGFAALKYISDNTIDQMIAIRGDGFKNWEDFDERVPKKLINKTALLSLWVAGAFRNFTKVDIDYRLGMDINEMNDAIINQYSVCGMVIHNMGIKNRHDRVQDLKIKKSVLVPAYVIKIKEIYTRHHEKMAFVEIEDISGRYETTWFPESWKDVDIKVGNLYEFRLAYSRGFVGIRVKEYRRFYADRNKK